MACVGTSMSLGFVGGFLFDRARLKQAGGWKEHELPDEIRGMNFKCDFMHQRRGCLVKSVRLVL